MTAARMQKESGPARRRAGLFAAFLLLAGGAMARDAVIQQPAGGIGDADNVSVELSGDLLITVKAHEAPVRHILAEIARQCDLDIVSYAPLDVPVSVNLERLPLSRTIARILRDQSYTLYARRPVKHARHGGQSCAGLLWVFSDESMLDAGQGYTGTDWMIERLRAQLTSDDVRTRQIAIRDLEKLGVQEAVGPLAEALADENAKIRVKAVYALSEIGGENATAVLATALADESSRVRAQTAYALGAIGGDSAIPILKLALQDADRHVRETAISAFTEIGGDRSAEAVAIALQDVDTDLRIEAVDALQNIGGGVATRLLVQASREHDGDVGEAAREAISILTKQAP